jgi:3'-phosphoadenosine 5'-phosphosulfate synthase
MVESSNAPVARKSGHEVLTGATYWFTGLSGAGKSTLSEYCKAFLDKDLGSSKAVFILDGDVIRTGLNKDLGFSPEARKENIRRITEVSKLFNMAGMIVFVAFISPYAADRDAAKEAHVAAGLKFYECYISANLEVCEGRDVKGLYKKARDGTIPNFTGVTAPYDEPTNCDININTGELPIEACKNMVVRQMEEAGVLRNLASPRVVDSLVVEPTEAQHAAMKGFPTLHINKEQAEYLQTIAEGFAFPLTRFMNEMELLESMQMQTITDKNGQAHLLSVPITQFCNEEEKTAIGDAPAVNLVCDELGADVLAVIHKPVFFANRKEEISTRTFGTFSQKHPKIECIMAQGDWLISGDSMHFCKHVMFNDGIDKYRLTPRQIQAAIKEKNADAVYAFQVRNPLHNGHCLLLNDTREQLIKQGYKNPILLLHPLGGWCKDDDVPLDTRMA